MVKAKSADNSVVSVEFLRTGNPWIDAGIVGLYRVLRRRPGYLTSAPEKETAGPFPHVSFDDLREDRLVVSGPADEVQACLKSAYDRLIESYFNVSTQKQKNEKTTWNLYYDTNGDCFVPFAKKKAVGAASLLFDKAPRPSGGQIPWGNNTEGEREVGILPASHAALQSRLDDFLAANSMKPGPPAGLLIDGENEVRPKVEIQARVGKTRGVCFLTGTPESNLVEAKETAFPLLGGSRSFVNGAADWPKMGWKIDFVGKFVPAVAFFYHQGDDLHIFFPESSNLKRIDELADQLLGMKQVDPNLFRNFDLVLGTYLQGRSEVALAFLHRVFTELSKAKEAESHARLEQQAEANSELEPEENEVGESAETDLGEKEFLPRSRSVPSSTLFAAGVMLASRSSRRGRRGTSGSPGTLLPSARSTVLLVSSRRCRR